MYVLLINILKDTLIDFQAQAPATDVNNISLGIKKPKRVIHFSDGVMEEYSSDEEDGPNNAKVVPAVDPVSHFTF